MGDKHFNVGNILGKAPGEPKLEEMYTVGKQIGKGAFGIVRLATKKTNGEQFAVKSISKAKLVCKEDVKDVQAEVAIMNLVAGHQNVVTIRVGILGGLAWRGGARSVHAVHGLARSCHGGSTHSSSSCSSSLLPAAAAASGTQSQNLLRRRRTRTRRPSTS
jgi:hypothetical protein